MMRPSRSGRLLVVAVVGGAVLGGALAGAWAQARPAPHPAPPRGGAGRQDHGTPAGWRFRWPAGDPARGRAVFLKLECYSCHEVRGESFPAPSEPGKVGPELSAMGPLHEAEYFAEAIINPSAVIDRGKGYEAADGSSKMPSYGDVVTVQEVVDLVAYLRALAPPAAAPGGHGGHQ